MSATWAGKVSQKVSKETIQSSGSARSGRAKLQADTDNTHIVSNDSSKHGDKATIGNADISRSTCDLSSHEPAAISEKSTTEPRVALPGTSGIVSGASGLGSTIDNTSSGTIYQDKDLQGFIPASKIKYKSYYVAGILTKDSRDATVKGVSDYVLKRLGNVRSVWRLREAGNTTSVKLVVRQSDVDSVESDEFWPSGILCRRWQYREHTKND